ncbi:hypothetical protein BFP97_19770 [Roseivirga sp. 4D4]|uniref:DUF6263 family protein n=1 Tax=Roseivirga sp. 4D4 TaxID=1889784 RepID=UPI0008535786|nr:DUF6263 family protein [Roseivirga sp. 4D4]OEK03616.1 hypothetical protein BFP97_19770 [Roseivirga sp. 4D4]
MKFKKEILALLGLFVALNLSAQKPTEYKLNKGDQFRVSVVVKQDIEQNMFGQNMTTTQEITTIDLYEVVDTNNDGFLFKTTGLSRTLLSKTPQGSMSMDSDLDGDEHLAFRALSGKSYYIWMNKYGKVLSIEGLDELGEAVKKDLTGTVLESSADQLLTSFDAKTLTTSFDGQFYIYKEPGKQWDREANMVVNNLPISVTYAFSYSGDAEITSEGDMILSGEFETMGQQMTAEMIGTQKSVFSLDAQTGMSKSIKTIQELEGELSIQGTSVPMSLKTEVTVEITK